MSRQRSYNDQDLHRAIGDARSWRGALRLLGLQGTSAGAMRSIRARADLLGIEYSHFESQQRWSKAQLAAAIASGSTWRDVAAGLSGDSASELARMKGHALRLGLDTAHLSEWETAERTPPEPMIGNLSRAAPMLAAAWFTLSGYDVSWPLEPCRYDLLTNARTDLRRVQVKSTRTRTGDTWKVYLSTSRGGRTTYSPDEIDDFFVIDGDCNFYLLPIDEVGGFHMIHLSGYERFRVPTRFTGSPPASGGIA
ncbi:group I intron-associated PD-(D/E)XK endonuclease [Agrococcus sp. KRD186]|uniref:group I intron-associated PD-(D/E)XK endonuclease n=1 Tax=Agrococcus sp. KRD186 TaxID=2729730 RepID=UPI0019D11E05|nr:group I intron-associated PD-(D/E)XK endonuclease [Agrococcus sp. KRD186]